MPSEFRILFVADVVGRPGREAVAALLPDLRQELEPQLTIVNGENSAGGFGITAAIVAELRRSGADVVTTGNHVWDQKQFVDEIVGLERVLRPANYPPGAPGTGHLVIEAEGESVLVMNLMGRLFINDIDDPFRAADAILAAHPQARLVFCDMHAEATSEKIGMGWHLDGRVTAVVGTHTHVPTADARVLPGGTAYISDVGMTGPRGGVIGVKREQAVEALVTQMPVRFETSTDDPWLNAVLIRCTEPRRAEAIEQLLIPAAGVS